MSYELTSASFLKSAEKQQSFRGVEIPSIEVPKGGGALKSVDEKFSVNVVNGSSSINIPIPLTSARALTPSLTLSYSSDAGNGPFGMGWFFSVGSISRSTARQLPRYQDEEESDTFLFSEVEDLVPRFQRDDFGNLIEDGMGGYILDKVVFDGCSILRYMPRTEGSFHRIERITNLETGLIFWKVTNRAFVTTYFGLTEAGRIFDPDHPCRTFQWLPELVVDHLGNCICYQYKQDESNRYLSHVRYGNKKPYDTALSADPASIVLPGEDDFFYDVALDYGEYSVDCETKEWNLRPDCFSSYRSGFEIRTKRLCNRFLVFHNFEELGGKTLVRSLNLSYKQDECLTLLETATQKGYIRLSNGAYSEKSLPPQVFQYQSHAWNTEVVTPECDSQIPAGLGGEWQLVDLYNEGIPGLLYELNGTWFYKRNLGNGLFDEAVKVLEKPNSGFSQGLSFSDLEGNGRKQLVCLKKGQQGYFSMDDDGKWQTFHTFGELPNIDLFGADVRFIDLTGDGKADLLITEDHALTWYASAGKDGYGERISLPIILEENDNPALTFSDSRQCIFLADMTGDGRTDVVRIRQGEVCYWPNLGYGRFGDKITMAHAPVFDSPESFDARRILLSDVNGTGTADLIYVGTHGFRVWLNACGNAFKADPFTIAGFPDIHSLAQVTVSDLLGTGTTCIVWSSSLAKDLGATLRYIDLMSSRKPYLMAGYSNSMGKKICLEYRPSTALYLDDRKEGKPWTETVHFPVHCLCKVTTKDLVAGWQITRSYHYRDAFYDHDEREFRGFAYVEEKDVETALVENAFRSRFPNLDQEPIICKSWNHSGMIKSGDVEISASRLLVGFDMSQLSLKERKQAVRCVKGSVLKNEVWDESGNLYQRETCRSRVEMIQPKGQNHYAVFLQVPVETVTSHYEKNLEDPRIGHNIVLETDEYGNALRSVQIAYPRKNPDLTLPEVARQSQAKTVILYTKNRLTGDVNTQNTYLLRQPSESLVYEVQALGRSGELYSVDDFNGIDQASMQLQNHSKVLYYDSALRESLPLHSVAFPAFVFESYQMIGEKNLFSEIFEGKVTSEMLLQSRYVEDDEGSWWVHSGRVRYLQDGEETVAAKSRFYSPISYEDSFGGKSTVDYYKDYYQLVERVTDSLGNYSEVSEFDIRTMLPKRICDQNKNLTEILFDELGMPKASAVLGKGAEADSLDGLQEVSSAEEEALMAQLLEEDNSIEITRIARTLLKGASARYLYFPHCFSQTGTPLTTIAITREEYQHCNPESKLQVSYEYASGLGNSVLKKVQAENDADSQKENGSFRWLGNGRIIFNNKGNAVMEFDPYFSDTPKYEDSAEMVEQGVSPVLHYDALGRVVRVDLPDGTFQKEVFDPWTVCCYNSGDCVKESTWYKQRCGDEAAAQSEIYEGTPSKISYDTLGQPAVMMEYLRKTSDEEPEELITQAIRDVRGNILSVVDPRGNAVVLYKYDLMDRVLFQKGMDNGSRWMIADMEGKSVFLWDERGFVFETQYDVLKRPVLEIVHNRDENTENIVSRTIYGESLLLPDKSNLADLQKKNLIGNVVKAYDTAGLIETDAYNFQYLPLETTRCLAKDYKYMVNWTENRLASDLEQEQFSTKMKVDAMGRITEQTLPDGSVVSFEFNEGGLLNSQTISFADERGSVTPLKKVVYNAKRQREYVSYGNGVSVRYTFDPLTERIVRIYSAKNGGDVLQDLNYTYDAAGSIVQIFDKAVPVTFFDGRKIEGKCSYVYDSLGRLISATGRENGAALALLEDNFSDSEYIHQFRNGDAMAMYKYTQQFSYDAAGNILQMRHDGDSGNWTRNYSYGETDNRLLFTEVGGNRYNYGYHPRHGFMTAMPNLSQIGYDAFERVVSSSRQERCDGGTPETTYYQYDGEGNRIRKITECQADAGVEPQVKNQRVYMGCYEKYRCEFGADAGLVRDTVCVMDESHRFVMFERRNDVDDGTAKNLARYQLVNHLGSSCLELDQDAEVISYEEYHPYGTTAFQANNKEIRAAAKRYRYTGMERDEETGLAYHTARYYVPWLGRWLCCDPIGIAGGVNLYEYCEGNPVGCVDLSGCVPDDRVPDFVKDIILWGSLSLNPIHNIKEIYHDYSGENVTISVPREWYKVSSPENPSVYQELTYKFVEGFLDASIGTLEMILNPKETGYAYIELIADIRGNIERAQGGVTNWLMEFDAGTWGHRGGMLTHAVGGLVFDYLTGALVKKINIKVDFPGNKIDLETKGKILESEGKIKNYENLIDREKRGGNKYVNHGEYFTPDDMVEKMATARKDGVFVREDFDSGAIFIGSEKFSHQLYIHDSRIIIRDYERMIENLNLEKQGLTKEMGVYNWVNAIIYNQHRKTVESRMFGSAHGVQNDVSQRVSDKTDE